MTRIIFLGLFITMHLSCKDEVPQSLSWEEKNLLDSLYNDEVLKVHPLLDSLCDQGYDSLVNYYRDSLWDERIEEITRQLERIQLK